MKKVYIITSLILFLFVIGCQQAPQTEEKKEITKETFQISTKQIQDFEKTAYIAKTGKILSKDDILVQSQASGKIKRINFKKGNNVESGKIVIEIEDTYNQFKLNLDRTLNSLDSAKINYEQTEISLNKAIDDAGILVENAKNQLENAQNQVNIANVNLEKSKNDLELTKADAQELKRKAEKELSNANLNNVDSISSLNIEKLENDLKKAELDYNSAKNSNIETINGYKRTLENQNNSLHSSYKDIIDFSDKILGVTLKNQYINYNYKSYIGAKNNELKRNVEELLKELIQINDNFYKGVYNNYSDAQLKNEYEKVYNYYIKIDDFLLKLKDVFDNSVSGGDLMQSTIDGWIAGVNNYQTLIKSHLSSFTGTKNSLISFLNTYKQNEESIAKNIELIKQNIEIQKKTFISGETDSQINYNKTLISIENMISGAENVVKQNENALKSAQTAYKNAETSLKSAENTLNNAKQSKDITLKAIENSIQAAAIANSEAKININKLQVKAPISGIIGEILVDVGQEVSPGTSLFTIISKSNQEIEIGYTPQELEYISIDKIVDINYNGNIIEGKIGSISKVADNNLNYKTTIYIQENISIIGEFVEVLLPIETQNILLPLNIVNSSKNGKGNIYILENNQPVIKEISIGKTWKDKIEVLDDLDPFTSIIISDMKNYDKNKFELKIVNNLDN